MAARVCSFFYFQINNADKGLSGMLVLGRRPGEYLMIDNNIMVKVVKSDEGHLRLAIEAPKHVSIVRGELLEGDSFAWTPDKKL